MLMLMNGVEVTTEDLDKVLYELKEGEVLELVDTDKDGNLYFERNVYGIYC